MSPSTFQQRAALLAALGALVVCACGWLLLPVGNRGPAVEQIVCAPLDLPVDDAPDAGMCGTPVAPVVLWFAPAPSVLAGGASGSLATIAEIEVSSHVALVSRTQIRTSAGYFASRAYLASATTALRDRL